MKIVNVNVGQKEMLVVINKDGIMINVNVKNLFGIKDLF